MTNSVLQAYRLSPQQARLWALGSTSPALPLGVACALGLRGELDADGLAEALARVVARHEILRTAVRPGAEGEPVQVVDGSVPGGLEVRDLAGLPERERAAVEAAAWAAAVAPHGGAADGAPLRAVLFRRAADDHVLHLSLSA
ncbi:MAG TPA: condensation domain-containing protein, partial [Longimicrobium sp.]|nr:condensation domain-containing protein [Longimicrobium sp.]